MTFSPLWPPTCRSPLGCAQRSMRSARQECITLAGACEADPLPLMRSAVAEAGLYTVLPIHAVAAEVKQGRLQAAKIVSPTCSEPCRWSLARTKDARKRSVHRRG